MLGRELVRPLEEDWRETLDTLARARGWATSHDVARLAAHVAALSAAYNDASRASAAVKDAGAARLGFSFPRDVPKGAAAVRELVATGALGGPATLRVLDIGAGLGATTWGVVRALEAAGTSAGVEATWVDGDARALEVASSLVRAREARKPPEGGPRVVLQVETLARRLDALDDLPRFDLVLVGQVLSELDVGESEETRAERHAKLLGVWLDRRVEPHGSLVVIEPALRDRSRHLHRVRDALVATGATVFAPCLHSAPCPALVRDTDWCHEDLTVDLPPWLAPVARAAGLRREGLTFSYAVFRKDGRRLGDAVPLEAAATRATRLRVVSGAIPSKGKREAFLCGELASPDGRVVVRARTMRLDRDASPTNGAWDRIARGDVLTIDPAPELDRPRVGRGARVSLSGDSESR
jgi:hypothetical protein